MTSKPETKITVACIQWIKDVGGDAWHVHGSAMQRAGEPDIDGVLPYSRVVKYGAHEAPQYWIHLKIEVKTATGKPSELQIERLRRYSKMGYCAGIVTSVDELKALYEAYRGWIIDAFIPGFQPLYRYLKEHGIADEYEIYDRPNVRRSTGE